MKANFLQIMAQAVAAGIALMGLVFPNQACAQFTGDNQTNLINGTTVNWTGYYHIGSNYVSDALFILNGGFLSTAGAMLGSGSGASSNLAVVSGSGSVWTNGPNDFNVGYFASGNRLVISDGGRVQVRALNTVVGNGSGSNNSVLVTGTGSVWTNSEGVWLGDDGGAAHNSLTISNGGAVFSRKGYVGNGGLKNNAIITGTGSVWSNRTFVVVGFIGQGNSLTVSNGGALFNTDGFIGYVDRAQSNSVLVTGNGSVWNNSEVLYVGRGVLSSSSPTDGNRLVIADGGSVLASNLYLGFYRIASNSLLSVSSGNLTVTNLSGTGTIDVRSGRLAFNGGTITTDRLWLTNGSDSILEFNSGTLHSKGTLVSNTQPCVVGDAVASANFHLLGGLHSFQDGLRIRSNSFLTGCGTVNGNVVVEAGGAVHANCTNLVFNSAVTNNAAMVVDGAVLETFGTFVNHGKIYLINGGATNFHGPFINHGTICNGDVHLAIAQNGSGGVSVHSTGVPTVTYRLQRAATVTGPWSDVATNAAPASGLIEFHETTPLPGQAFYRAVQP